MLDHGILCATKMLCLQHFIIIFTIISSFRFFCAFFTNFDMYSVKKYIPKQKYWMYDTLVAISLLFWGIFPFSFVIFVCFLCFSELIKVNLGFLNFFKNNLKLSYNINMMNATSIFNCVLLSAS